MVLNGLKSDNPPEFTLLVRNPDQIQYTQEEKAKLTLVKGSADDKDAVRRAVENADVVVFSIGSAPTKTMQMADPDVCARCSKVLLDVVSEMDKKPNRIIFVSSTGVTDKSEVPLLLRPLYKLLISKAHEDKRAMEEVVHAKNPVDHIIVRPSMFTDGAQTEKYRTSSERLVGYTVSRADVGHFMFTQCLDKDTWLNKSVIVTN
ncbi:hypothetical protein DM01DRAFT_1410203 [Hesseltinella vesiculosa]|uniref:NAD(P)-binding domain-containing protein n=1 Tax=Hesseltinella vesiculosa TaxID=101127 RepID=A0A1X2G851_9FUNG|nr:hypothetical protein DM01DRAFT_1410203 [Hesseltinella vesiculosa]